MSVYPLPEGDIYVGLSLKGLTHSYDNESILYLQPIAMNLFWCSLDSTYIRVDNESPVNKKQRTAS